MGPTLSPETSAFKLQTPGKFPKEYKLHYEHGESLKTTSWSLSTIGLIPFHELIHRPRFCTVERKDFFLSQK